MSLQKMIHDSRTKVTEAIKALRGVENRPLEYYKIILVRQLVMYTCLLFVLFMFIIEKACVCVCRAVSQWKDHPMLTEADVSTMAERWKSSNDTEHQRRMTTYEELLSKQHSVSFSFGLIYTVSTPMMC